MSISFGRFGEIVSSLFVSPKKTITNNNNESSKKRKNSSEDIRLVYDSPVPSTLNREQNSSSKKRKTSPAKPTFIQLASKPFVSLINVLTPKPSFRTSIRNKRRRSRHSTSPIQMQDLSKPDDSTPKKEYEPTPYVTRIPWSMTSPVKTTHPDTTFVSVFNRLDLLEEEDKYRDSKTMDRYLSQEVIRISRANPPSPKMVEPVTPSPKKSMTPEHNSVMESEHRRLMEERSALNDRWKKIMSDRKKIIDLTDDDDVISAQNYEKIKSPIHSYKFSRQEQERLEREKHIKEELAKLRSSGKTSTVKLTKEEEEIVRETFEEGFESDTLVEGFNLKISRGDIMCLQDGEWLGDEVDIFSKEKVIVPVHLGNHWCCAVINFKDKQFEYYDSLGGQNYECLELLREYVVKEYKDKKKGSYDLGDWEDFMPSAIPKQMNGYDCGVFMCRFAYCAALNMPFKFSQKEMQYLRKRMLLDILSKTLTV